MTRFKTWLQTLKERNWHYRILALILAVVIWFYVTGPAGAKTNTIYTVPLEFRNLETGFSVTEMPETVRMVLDGSGFEAGSLGAYVDLAGLSEGEHRLEVVPSTPITARLLSLTPSYVMVRIESEAQTVAEVKARFGEGKPAEGFGAEAAVLSPSQVTVSGAKSDVETIADVFVLVDLTGRTESFDAQLPVYVKDAAGNYITDRFAISPATVRVVVPVLNDGSAAGATLPVKIPTKGNVAAGYAVTSIVGDPGTVTVYGDVALLESIASIETEPVDIGGLKKTVTTKTMLKLPESLRYFGSREVLVVITIAAKDTAEDAHTETKEVAVQVLNGSDEYTYRIEPATAKITLRGAAAEENGLFVDVAGREQGAHQLAVLSHFAGDTVKIEPELVTVHIEKQ